eukprot:7034818-Pyramimonas_sp.AAC.1
MHHAPPGAVRGDRRRALPRGQGKGLAGERRRRRWRAASARRQGAPAAELPSADQAASGEAPPQPRRLLLSA